MLKLQYFGHLMWKANSMEKTLMLGKAEGNRRGGRQRTRWSDSITNSMDMNLGKLWDTVENRGVCVLQLMGSQSGTRPSNGKESACNAGDLGSIPGLGRSPGEGKGYPLQFSGLENSMDCGVAKNQTWLSYFHFHFTFPQTGLSHTCSLCFNFSRY